MSRPSQLPKPLLIPLKELTDDQKNDQKNVSGEIEFSSAGMRVNEAGKLREFRRSKDKLENPYSKKEKTEIESLIKSVTAKFSDFTETLTKGSEKPLLQGVKKASDNLVEFSQNMDLTPQNVNNFINLAIGNGDGTDKSNLHDMIDALAGANTVDTEGNRQTYASECEASINAFNANHARISQEEKIVPHKEEVTAEVKLPEKHSQQKPKPEIFGEKKENEGNIFDAIANLLSKILANIFSAIGKMFSGNAISNIKNTFSENLDGHKSPEIKDEHKDIVATTSPGSKKVAAILGRRGPKPLAPPPEPGSDTINSKPEEYPDTPAYDDDPLPPPTEEGQKNLDAVKSVLERDSKILKSPPPPAGFDTACAEAKAEIQKLIEGGGFSTESGSSQPTEVAQANKNPTTGPFR